MQSFGAFFNDNKALTISLVLIAGLVSLAILMFLYRLAFGRRLHMAGGRPRQPRLGVIDSFDLDRQRQLVLIRRDNVEHLIMIGGPNDLVIESAFVRMQPSLPVPVGRDKDVGASLPPVAPMALPVTATPSAAIPTVMVDTPGAPSGVSAAPPVATEPNRSAVPPLDLTDPVSPSAPDPLAGIPAPAPVAEFAAPEALPAVATAPQAEEGPKDRPEPPSPVPAQPPAPPASRFATTFPPRQLGATPGTPSPRSPLSTLRTSTPPAPRTVTPGPRPFPSAPLSRGTSAASLRRDPPGAPAPPADAGAASPEPSPARSGSDLPAVVRPAEPRGVPPAPVEPAPATAPPLPPSTPAAPPPRPAPSLPTTLDTLESLEEEMAKLLGRPPAATDKATPER